MRKQQGFTVVEVIFVIIVLLAAGLIFWHQKVVISGKDRDLERKTAINAMSYALDHVYYAQKHYYPQTLTPQTFSVISPDLMKDPAGRIIGDQDSDYRYEPANCSAGHCQAYTLRSQLEYEADYVKTSTSSPSTD